MENSVLAKVGVLRQCVTKDNLMLTYSVFENPGYFSQILVTVTNLFYQILIKVQ